MTKPIGCIRLRFTVTVDVDPSDAELLDLFDRRKGKFLISEVVLEEIVTNLESVSYVGRVSVERKKEVKP